MDELTPPRLSVAGLVDLLRAEAASVPSFSVRLGTDSYPPSTTLSPQLGAALTRAAGEALRNAARHGGVDTAWVEIEADVEDRRGRIRIRDEGVGFAAQAQEGFGIAYSIRRPVEDAGGQVRYLDGPAGGTVVELNFPIEVETRGSGLLESTYRLTRAGIGQRLGVVNAIALPQGLVWSYLAVRWSVASPRTSGLLALAAVFATLTLLVGNRLRRSAPAAVWTCCVVAAICATHAIGMALIPAGALLNYRSWPTGFAAVPMLMLCVFLPVRYSLLLVSTQVVLVLAAWRVDPALSSGLVPVGSLNAVVATPVLGIAVGLLLRRTGRHVLAENRRLVSATRLLAARRSTEAVSSLYLDHTRRVVVPWLEEVASGRVPLESKGTKEHAGLLGLETRDDLYAPGFLSPALRQAVSAFRAHGGTVELRAGFAPGGGDRSVGRALHLLAGSLPPGTRVIASPHAMEGEARIAITPPPPHVADVLTDLVHTLGHRVPYESDAFGAVITVREPHE